MSTKKYQSCADLAAEFGVSTRTVKRWIKDGLLSCLKINGRPYFSEQHKAEFVARASGPDGAAGSRAEAS